MYTRIFILLLILNVRISSAFATIPWYVMDDFGNVKTRTSSDYTQVTVKPGKASIIGELARRLAEELNYTKPVFLDFRGSGSGRPPECLVSFDDGTITWVESGMSEKAVLESPGIVVRQQSGRLDPAATLMLLEYAIHNVEMIRSEQRPQPDRNKRVNSIDAARIQEVLAKPVSPTIQRVWKTRVPASESKSRESVEPAGVSYGFENGVFVVYAWDRIAGETILLSLKDIYDFQELSSSHAVVFDTADSFYYVDRLPKRCSRRHVIKDTHDFAQSYDQRYDVVSLGHDKIAICFTYWVPLAAGEQMGKIRTGAKVKYRAAIYHAERDDLIQDLDAAFDK